MTELCHYWFLPLAMKIYKNIFQFLCCFSLRFLCIKLYPRSNRKHKKCLQIIARTRTFQYLNAGKLLDFSWEKYSVPWSDFSEMTGQKILNRPFTRPTIKFVSPYNKIHHYLQSRKQVVSKLMASSSNLKLEDWVD